HRLSRPHDRDVDPELLEATGASFEERELRPESLDDPTRVLRVENEPAVTGGSDPLIGLLERRLGNGHDSQSSLNSPGLRSGKRAYATAGSVVRSSREAP